MRMLLLLLIALSLAAPATATTTYTDPFAYCAAAGDIDAPDARWAGDRVPLVIARALRKEFTGTADGPLEFYIKGSHWRCMGGQVYACNVGANIPCLSKANTSRTPTEAMRLWCRERGDSDFIPMYTRDRANIYDWRCKNGAPAIIRQLTRPDARGFLTNVWYRIAKNGGTP